MPLDFSACRIAVVGDVILDRYVEGSVARISPEAPVAVLARTSEREVLGGAANVAANLAALGARVAIVGVVGADEAGVRLARLLDTRPGIAATHVVTDATRPTTSKTRVMSGLHQLVRIDSETTTAVAGAVEAALLRAVRDVAEWADVLILSDYAKGACSDPVIRALIEAAARLGKPSLVDPKRRDFAIYRGATLIKPNRRELTAAARSAGTTDEALGLAAHDVIAQTGADILLTRADRGMSYYSKHARPLHVPTAVRDVFDVSGAGDTAMAVVALGLAIRVPMQETMRLANSAAGIVVGKVGTAVVTLAELDAALGDTVDPPHDKGALLSLPLAVRQRETWGRLGLRVGFTNGCYDLLHPGHVALLKMAARSCDRLIVALNSDASVRRLKGPTRPVQDQGARAMVLGALAAVDLVVLFDEETPAGTIAALKPDLLVKGADYLDHQVAGADFVRAGGGEVLLVPLVLGQSTSAMIARGARL